MRNIWRLFRNDVKRLSSNAVTGIIVLGLVLLPSLFSWYNVIACWDVFDNTGNLKVAVANTDEGYVSDLVPLEVNVGEQVVSELRANDQLNWTFTTEEDAIDGARSGRYYAAVVIPPSFSKDMMTFYSEDVEHAQIAYYTNEKKSAVAPKVTDQGADQVSYQVNEVFTSKLNEIALGLATAFADYAESADLDSRIGVVAERVSAASSQMAQASATVSTYAQVMSTAQQLVGDSSALLSQARSTASEVGTAADEGQQAISEIGDAMGIAADALSVALRDGSAGYDEAAAAIDEAFAATGAQSATAAGALRAQADAADAQVASYRTLVTQLEDLEGRVDAAQQPAVHAMVEQLNASIAMQENLALALRDGAKSIEQGNADAQAQHERVKQLAAQAAESLKGLATEYEQNVKPNLEALASDAAQLAASLKSNAAAIDDASGKLAGSADSVTSQLASAHEMLTSAATELSAASVKLAELATKVGEALAANDIDTLRDVLGGDLTAFAAALAAPVGIERIAVFPADNFGSQMAPLYTTLAIWIGSLLMLVAMKTNVSDAARTQLSSPRAHELFLGRFGIFAPVSLLQTTVLSLGNMWFLKVQVNEPLLYLLCFWLAGLVFTFVIYTLVVSFANLGKAIAVLLLIVQVTSGGGSFPLQLLPDFFQTLSPYMPATHVINAMRAAMMGTYAGDFWLEMGALLLFVVPAALLGLVLRKPLARFLDWYIEKVEDSKLVA